MKRRLLKILSFTMMLAMLISTMQVTLAVMAADLNADDTAFDSALNDSDFVSNDKFETADTADTTQYESVAYVIGEDESLRKENEKHFRMSDGTYVAAVYPEAVHYLEDDEWKEIDNTLSLTEDGYKNTAGTFEVVFGDGSSDELYTITDGDHSVKLMLLRPTDDKTINATSQVRKVTLGVNADDNAETFDVKSAASAVEEYKAANPDADENEIEAIASAQREENKRQREYMLRPKNLTSSISYADVLGEVDFEYVVTPTCVKENIILSDANDGNVFGFTLDTELTPSLNDDGSVDLLDGDEVVFSMPAPYMYDAAGNTSYDVTYDVVTVKDQFLLAVEADPVWLSDPARIFPVTIDPTISVNTSTSHWSYYYYSDDYEETPEEVIPIGYNEDLELTVAHFHMSSLPSIPYNCKFNSATISLAMFPEEGLTIDGTPTPGYSSGGVPSFNIFVQEALTSWTTQFDDNKQYNENPIIDYQTVSSSSMGSFIEFDISNAVSKWYADSSSNKGIVFFPKLTNGQDMTSSNHAMAYFLGPEAPLVESTNGLPILSVTYRNYTGVEDYYTYQTAGAGRAGTAYLSHYTGYFTLIRPLVEGTGFTLSYVYNSPYGDWFFTSNNVFNTVNYTSMQSHKGWRLNVQQSVVEKTLSVHTETGVTNVTQLVYSDGDGTEHYFRLNDETSVYEDEDGLNLTITKNGTTYTLSDEKGNKKIFRHGYLSEILDTNGNRVVMLYDTETYSENGTAWHPKTSGTQLKKIIYIPDLDKNHPITVATLQYNSSTKLLTSITDRAGRTLTLNHSESLLTSIKDYDNVYSYYRHSANYQRMCMAYDDEADYGLSFTYYDNSPNMVYDLSDYTTPTTYNTDTWVIQNSILTNITGKTSRFRHTGGDNAINGGDDVITTYVFDRFGRTVTARSEDNNGNTIGASGGKYTVNKDTDEKNNKLTKQGGTGAIAQDLLLDSGFELSGEWEVSRADETHYSADICVESHRTGSKSYKLFSSAVLGWVGIYDYITLPGAGTYTLSAYVKLHNIGDIMEEGSGVRCAIKTTSDEILGVSRYVCADTDYRIDDGWTKLTCSYTATSSQQVMLAVTFSGTTGTVYVDDIQLEKSETASPFNLLEVGNFTSGYSSYWTDSSYASVVSETQYDGTRGKVLKLSGSPSAVAYATQYVHTDYSAAETYILSGWAKAESVPTDDIPEGENVPTDVRTFGLLATVVYVGEDRIIEHHYAEFSYMISGQWQYVALPIVPKNPTERVDHINVSCLYYNNANTAYFDDVSLIREAAQSFTYDDEGHLQTVNKTNSDELSNLYEDGNLLAQDGGAAGLYSYSYDDAHNLIKAVNDGITMDLSYDENGNVVSTTLSDGTGSSDMYMSTSATYTDGGTKVQSTTDNLGNTTSNTYYTEENLLSTVTYPLSSSNTDNAPTQTVNYQYNTSDRMSISYITGKVSLNYSYSKGQVASIVRGGYYGSLPKIEQTYSFTYNDYGQTTSTSVGDRTLSTNTYDNGTHNLSGITYGNGDSVTYTYDNLDRLKTVVYNDLGKKVTYYYDYMSYISKATVTNTSGTTEYATYHYEYDTLGRLVRYYETLGNNIVQQVECSYDTKNRVSSYVYYDGAELRDARYVYDDAEGGVLTKYDYGEEGAIGYEYDELNRVTQKYMRHTYTPGEAWNVFYTYKDINTNGKTSSLVTQINYYDTSAGSSFKKLNYTYDNLGNITLITDENGKKLGRYLYDSQNQLVLEEVYPEARSGDPYTMVYEYDTFGNIRKAIKFSSTGYSGVGEAHGFGTILSTETYTYGDSTWADLLTSYNGTSITYDAMGNPTSYYNGKSYVFSWENGRQLASATVGNKTVSFEYNADGIRTEKQVTGQYTEKYRLDGDRVVELVRTYNSGNIYRLAFAYDESGNPFSVDCYYGADDTTPDTYYYVLNLQGDVIQLLNENDVVAATYTYDAWGKVLSVSNASNANIVITTHISNLNPFRYRGYFYDIETGFYYCNSRYYDPQMRRFINADESVSTGQGYTSYNMYTYCLNNPVMMYDEEGESSKWAPLFALHDFGYFHRAVQRQILVKSGGTLKSEVWLPNFRRMDIYNSKTGEVWEVKYDNLKGTGITNAEACLEKYDGQIDKNNVTVKKGKAGCFSGTFTENTVFGKYEVTYYTPKDGVILYNFEPITDVVPDTEAIANPQKEESTVDSTMTVPELTPAPLIAFGGGGAILGGGFRCGKPLVNKTMCFC